MSAVVVQCPHCSVSLKLKAAPRPGAKLKCPKCQKVFSPAPDDVPADEEFADLPPLPPRGGLPPRIGASSKSKSVPAAKSKKKESGSGVPVVLIASIVGVVVLAGIGGGAYFMLRGGGSGPDAADKSGGWKLQAG